jgi:hypothetical protein
MGVMNGLNATIASSGTCHPDALGLQPCERRQGGLLLGADGHAKRLLGHDDHFRVGIDPLSFGLGREPLLTNRYEAGRSEIPGNSARHAY